jgi:hypothetical protein
MTGPELAPARPERLVWHAPSAGPGAAFDEVRRRLERLLTRPAGCCVYEAKRRAIWRMEDDALGPVGVKEVRSEGLLRSVWFRFGAEHPALREFRVGAAFQARGGETPPLLGAAVDGGPLSVDRVVIFVRWFDGATELTEHLRASGGRPDRTLLVRVAERLVADARLGLVHGRHGTSNLLLLPAAGGDRAIEAIDFAYSRLGDRFDPDGYARDAARVAVQMVRLGGVARETAREFIEIAARTAHADASDAEECRRAIASRVDRRLVETEGSGLAG